MSAVSTMTDTRAITLEIEIAASPARIWRALTEPEELMRWFPLEAKVTPGLGGSVWLSWGAPVIAESVIDVWEPERCLRTLESRPLGVLLQPKDQENPRRSVEYTIEPAGAKTRLRLTHAGFGAIANWDSVYSAVLRGWEFQFCSLQHYLESHDGQDRTVAWVKLPFNLPFDQVWERLMAEHGALGTGRLLERAAGERFEMSAPTGDVLTGTIVILEPPRQFTAIVENWNDALFRIYLVERPGGGGLDVSVWMATYGVPIDKVRGFQERWHSLIKNLFVQESE